tara:strand:- start:247 stop:627 length:381 start_codon:yes stop_codon:yes gene_type:complete
MTSLPSLKTIDFENLLLCKPKNEDTDNANKNNWCVIFAYNIHKKLLIGCKLIKFNESNKSLSLYTYPVGTLREVPKIDILNMTTEEHVNFDPDVSFTLGYIMNIGVPFSDEWANITYTRSNSITKN